jgi:Uma2 family endonuclease
MSGLTLNLRPTIQLTDEEFEQLCRSNPDLRLERSAKGELIAMSPTGSESGHYNIELATDLTLWNRQARLGVTFDSSTGFTLPNGAIRSPDAAWIEQSRWDALSPEQKRKFAPICPDFAIELKSPSDEIQPLQAKMKEYLDNGLCLGWLIDPSTHTVEIYRPEQPVEVLKNPATLSGELVLPGFVLDLTVIWRS